MIVANDLPFALSSCQSCVYGACTQSYSLLVRGQDRCFRVRVVHRKGGDRLGQVVKVLAVDLDEAAVDISLRVRVERELGDNAKVVERAL